MVVAVWNQAGRVDGLELWNGMETEEDVENGNAENEDGRVFDTATEEDA